MKRRMFNKLMNAHLRTRKDIIEDYMRIPTARQRRAAKHEKRFIGLLGGMGRVKVEMAGMELPKALRDFITNHLDRHERRVFIVAGYPFGKSYALTAAAALYDHLLFHGMPRDMVAINHPPLVAKAEAFVRENTSRIIMDAVTDQSHPWMKRLTRHGVPVFAEPKDFSDLWITPVLVDVEDLD